MEQAWMSLSLLVENFSPEEGGQEIMVLGEGEFLKLNYFLCKIGSVIAWMAQ